MHPSGGTCPTTVEYIENGLSLNRKVVEMNMTCMKTIQFGMRWDQLVSSSYLSNFEYLNYEN